MKAPWILAGMLVFALHAAAPAPAAVRSADGAQRDARGWVVRDGATRLNFVPAPSGEGWQRVALGADGEVIAREAVAPPHEAASSIADSASGLLLPSPAPLAAPATFPALTWTYAVFGTGIGEGGLLARDLDGDGTVEIVVGSASKGDFWSDDFWRILRKGPGGTYETVWTSRIYEQVVVRLALGDANHDGVSEIYVGLGDGTVEIHDGAAPGSPATVAVGHALTAMEIADTDGDGDPELLATNGTALSCRSLTPPYAQEWSLTSGGGTDLAVGQLDDDPAPEIAVTQGGGSSPGLVIDGATRLVQWSYANGFGRFVRCGDVDGDGRDEIVAAASWYKVTAFDVEIKTPKWEIAIDSDIGAMRLRNTDADAVPEIIVGEGQWGSILCFDAATRTQRWAIANPEHGVTDVEIADVNGDAAFEVLWGSGATSTGPDYLYVADMAARRIDWQSLPVDGPLTAVGSGDVDGDAAPETVLISYESESGYEDGIIHIFDGATHALEWSGDSAPTTMDWMGVRSVAVGDVDADARAEIVYTSAQIYDGKVVVFDGSSRTIKRASTAFNGNYFSALALADVDADGQVEIVAGQGREHTGALGVYLLVFDGASMAEEWRSVDLGSYWGEVSDIAVGCVDGDGRPEIVAAVAGGDVWVYDGTTHQLDWLAELGAGSVETADVDGDGTAEILLGRNGVVEAYDGVTHALKSSHAVGAGTIVGLRALAGAGGSAPFFASDGATVSRFAWAAAAPAWVSPPLGSNVGRYNHLVVGDVNGDGAQALLVGSHYALFEFRLTDGTPRVSSIVRRDANPAVGTSVDFTVTFTEPVTGVDTVAPFSDFALTATGVTGASIAAVSGSGDTYTVSVLTGEGDGTLRLDVTDDDSILDGNGNPLGGPGSGNGDFTSGEAYTVWFNPHVLSIRRADADPTSASSVTFTVTFSEPVTGVDLVAPFGDFAVTTGGATTGTVSAVNGSGDTYAVTVAVNPRAGNGFARLDVVDDDTVVDTPGNPLGGSGAGNGAFTAGEAYSIRSVPATLAPGGKISVAKPTYRWAKVPGATRYRYQLLKGSTVVYTRSVAAASCGSTTCSDAPTTPLGMGSHRWRAQALLAGAWGKYSGYRTFTVSPRAGYWAGTGHEFYVTPNLASVDDFAIYVVVTGCGYYKIYRPALVPIAGNRFAFSGSFYASGTFSSPSSASGLVGLDMFYIPGCGYLRGGPFSWSGTWRKAGQPSLAEAGDAGTDSVLSVPGSPVGAFPVEVVAPAR